MTQSLENLQTAYDKLVSEYGGISSTSTAKFDGLKNYFSSVLGISDREQVYIVGAGTRPTNLPIRFAQGKQSTVFTQVGVGFVEADAAKTLDQVSESCATTLRNYSERGRINYGVILLVLIQNGKTHLVRAFDYEGDKWRQKLRNVFPDLQVETVSFKGVRPGAVRETRRVNQHGAVNAIIFGSPGTGKSYKVAELCGESSIFKTQFHPEYTHGDFVGTYRPVVGFDSSSSIVGYDGVAIDRPINYFTFVPGPLMEALACAYSTSDPVFLVIEEINRGNCAGIFGDIFQLLDRNDEGDSEYGITIKPEIENYFLERSVAFDLFGDNKLRLPSNLSILATMNTSDQSLYPMDSAFKRRWDWLPMPIRFEDLSNFTNANRLYVSDGKRKWDWIHLLQTVNELIVSDYLEDMQIGPWFIKPESDGSIPLEKVLNKLLFYLWHDVFQHNRQSENAPFLSSFKTFVEMQEAIRGNGLASGLKDSLLVEIEND